MNQEVQNTLSRVVWPIIAITVVVTVTRLRGMSWRDDLGLRWPSLSEISLWLGLFVVLVVAEEVTAKAMGVAQVEPWGSKYSRMVTAIRVFAMVVLAPLSEELVFRGLLYQVFSKRLTGSVGAIFVTAFLFALLHLQYNFPAILFVLADGLFFGTARYFTGSTLLTTVLHSLGNGYAAYQRISG